MNIDHVLSWGNLFISCKLILGKDGVIIGFGVNALPANSEKRPHMFYKIKERNLLVSILCLASSLSLEQSVRF